MPLRLFKPAFSQFQVWSIKKTEAGKPERSEEVKRGGKAPSRGSGQQTRLTASNAVLGGCVAVCTHSTILAIYALERARARQGDGQDVGVSHITCSFLTNSDITCIVIV